jgi:hypothetical protein
MTETALETYVGLTDPGRVPIVRELDRLVMAANPGFDTGIYYRQLTYAIGGDFRRWVCAIDAHPKNAACLRFLYGVLLDDGRRVFRGAKTSPLRTIDIASVENIDPRLVTDYVKEAVSKFDQFKATEGAPKR